MATVTKAANSEADGTTDGTDLGRWADPSNAYATTGDDTYATAALDATKNSGRASVFGFPAFTTGDIPDGSTINSVTATVEWFFDPNVAGSTLGVQLVNAGTPLGTETTKTSSGEEQSTHQVTSGISLADLRSAGTILANVRYRKGNVTTTTTGNLDFCSLTVDYTEAAPTPTATTVAKVSLASGTTPDVRTGHAINVRARTTSGAGTINAALYEGASNRSGNLESSALTTSLANYTLSISEANATNITDYSDLDIWLWGYAAGGGAIVFEVAELSLSIPETTEEPPAEALPPTYFSNWLSRGAG